MKTTVHARRSMQRIIRPFALMIRIGDWMITHEGLFRYREHVDAKTGGQKARWKTWDKIWPNDPSSATTPLTKTP